MPIITRIYRTGKPHMSTVELDCGHKSEHDTASIKRWQWFIGRTGMVCPQCPSPTETAEPTDTYLDIEDLLDSVRSHLACLAAANDPHMTHQRMVQADSSIQAIRGRLDDIAKALANRRPTT